jgi:hypothetical protein
MTPLLPSLVAQLLRAPKPAPPPRGKTPKLMTKGKQNAAKKKQ